MLPVDNDRSGFGPKASPEIPLSNPPVRMRLKIHLNFPVPFPNPQIGFSSPFLQQTFNPMFFSPWSLQPKGCAWMFTSQPKAFALPQQPVYRSAYIADPATYFTRPTPTPLTGLMSPPFSHGARRSPEALPASEENGFALEEQLPERNSSPQHESPPLHSSLNYPEGLSETNLLTKPDPQNKINLTAATDEPDCKGQAGLKQLLSDYFFGNESKQGADFLLSPINLSIAKVFLIKKLVHDKKKSRIFHAIVELTAEQLPTFLTQHPAVNRKNIIKSNMFKRVWQTLEEARLEDFHDYYFGALGARFAREAFSLKAYRKNHSFNLADEFYRRCFSSKRFKKDFFAALRKGEVQRKALVQSRERFSNFFESWVLEVRAFMDARGSPFERSFKLPDFKFGLSACDIELTVPLFERVSIK